MSSSRPPKPPHHRHSKPARKFAPASKKTDEGPQRIVGILTPTTKGWDLQSTNRRDRGDYRLIVKTHEHLVAGHLAVAEVISQRHSYNREARLIKVLGDSEGPKAFSLIALESRGIPYEFDKVTLRDADLAKPVPLGKRSDLRDIPLVTIDGSDARDFDDAVFAEPDGEGWHLIVAIADVAHYVTTGCALDKTARERGNSVYLADRVVPMLPEALSNELCSLKPNVDRACMAVHMWIDSKGEMTKWQFMRGLMKSKARLTYEQAQHAVDGKPDKTTQPLLVPVLLPLYGAYRALLHARTHRGTLELDLPERKIVLDNEGQVSGIQVRERLDSHRLIEEFMILANVAAATELEQKRTPCLYRVHDRPSDIKLDGLRDFLATLEVGLVPAKQMHPRFLTTILKNFADTTHSEIVNDVILRSQAQAVYSPKNIGHFGLALAKYAHFTSPIRRYADLVVHRGLIRANKLGDDGLTDAEIAKMEDTAEHISTTERRAAAAERDVGDRFATLYLASHVGATFAGRISGVGRFGLFVRLNDTGAEGLIPRESLPDDYYIHDEKQQCLIGKRSRKIYRLSDPISVRLAQADTVTGSMSFDLVDADGKPVAKGPPRLQSPRHNERETAKKVRRATATPELKSTKPSRHRRKKAD